MAVAMAVVLLSAAAAHAANPPICPFALDWNSQITTWAQGAPWIKVLYSYNINVAHSCGAKVFYRPYDVASSYHDDGCLPSTETGATFADLVWAKISSLNPKPEAVGYRNEFNWGNPTDCKRTCAEFVNYKNRLRADGYTGKIIFGSFGVGWVDSAIWNDTDLTNAVNASDGVETHEYFDLTVNCCAPWLCFRHRDIAIANHAYLQSKDWYIGEYGSDQVCSNCTSCSDSQCRQGWRDRGKLTEQQYIDQTKIYRAGCASQVVAVFLFSQSSGSWANFEVLGTTVADYMKTTWNVPPGAISGTVKNSSGQNISGATVTLSSGGYTAQTSSSGAYTISNVTAGTYDVTASKAAYGQVTQTGKLVSSSQTTTVNFTLTPITPISTAKGLANGAGAILDGIVTAQFPVGSTQTQIYIEDANRVNGICVATGATVSLGDEVQCQGSMTTVSGERVLTASSVARVQSALSVPKKLGVNNQALGGGQFGLQGAVLNKISAGRFSTGRNNVGLLVRVWGKVTYVDPSGAFFYMDDGSAVTDGSGQIGIRVACTNLTAPTAGSNVTMTGVSGATQVGANTVRLLRPRSAADLSYVAAVNYLTNPGFEVGSLSGWVSYGSIDGIQSGTWFGGITAHGGSYFIGSAADGGTKSGGLYQRVPAAIGSRYQAQAWSRVYHAGNTSDSAQNKIGIDPTGGTSSTGANVQWSALDTQAVDSYSVWVPLSTPTVTCSVGYLTVFLDMRQNNNGGWHVNCFDGAGLYLTP